MSFAILYLMTLFIIINFLFNQVMIEINTHEIDWIKSKKKILYKIVHIRKNNNIILYKNQMIFNQIIK
jgi:hypothetical protein